MTHETSADTALNPEGASPACVLVVDDTIENLRLLSNMLSEEGYEVRAVTNGPQALEAVERDPPDVILLDISMPEMDGYEVCRRLKARDRSKDVPVIFLTALTDTADKVRAFDAGGVDYVTKPFQLEEVLARVKTQVTRRQARVALAGSYRRLHSLEQLRDDLVQMVVHDMRSPLLALLVNLRVLKRPGSALNDEGRETLEDAIQSAEALNRMANNLLDVSRLEDDKMPLQRAVWDLTQMACDVRSALGTLDRDRHIDIESPGVVAVNCDGALVRRVVENLVANGIRHTPSGSRLLISIAGGDGRVRVAVHDEGPGVPAEARQRIFEKFESVETRGASRYHSAGLGLAFCKLAIEAHGGTIGVDSRVSAGSTFWFELPV
jgi:two-component system, sensor histidine kinase and response regulator